MSVLDTPRIYFQGQITWDPLVTNNRPDYYDVETSRTVFGTGDVAAYRERARLWVLEDLAGHNWNVHGTHRSAFFNATVTGVDVGRGLRRKDDLTGVPVSLSGMLVDVDPYGFFTSQLFFDVFSCGIPGGCSVLARSCGPMVARRMNGRRILGDAYRAGGASAVWQTSFPTDRLSVHPRGSQVLAALAESMKKGKDVVGLTVR